MNQKILECLKEHFSQIGENNITGNDAIKIIQEVVDELAIPWEVEEAMAYISECHKDFGFMGSPEYYRKEKLVDNFFRKRLEEKKERLERENYLKLKEKYGTD